MKKGVVPDLNIKYGKRTSNKSLRLEKYEYLK